MLISQQISLQCMLMLMLMLMLAGFCLNACYKNDAYAFVAGRRYCYVKQFRLLVVSFQP